MGNHIARKNCINSWNMLTLKLKSLEKNKAKNKQIEIDHLKMHSKNKLKSVITEYFLSTYKLVSQFSCLDILAFSFLMFFLKKKSI